MINYEHDRDCGWLPSFYRHPGPPGHEAHDLKCLVLHTIARRICALCAQPIGYSRCYVTPPGHFRLYHTDCVDRANQHHPHGHYPRVPPPIPRRPPAYGQE